MRITIATIFALFAATCAMMGQSGWTGEPLEVTERFDHVVLVKTGKDRPIDFAFRDVVVRELERLDRFPGSVAFILEIDSPGGRVDAARDIVETIRGYRDSEDLRIFAWVPRSAISAAAWIAFACRGLFIHHDATIGDIQPIIPTPFENTGFTEAPRKIVTALAEEIVVTCRSNGVSPSYPALLMRAMVDPDLEIVAVYNDRLGTAPRFMRAEDFNALPSRKREGLRPEVLGHPGKALTTNGRDLPSLGFTVGHLENAEGLVERVGVPDAEWVIVDRSQQRRPLGLDLDWRLLLLIAGIVLVILELKAPGIGVFGIGGVGCLIAFFVLQAESISDAMWPIILLLVGAFLIVVEILLLPGTIFPGVIGAVLCLWATWLGVAQPDGPFVLPDPGLEEDRRALTAWGGLLVGSLVGGVGISFAFGRIVHRIPILGTMVLLPPKGIQGPEGAETGPVTPRGVTEVTAGSRGEALTDLRPAGTALLDGRRVDVVSRGTFIASGATVRVVEVAGNRVVVREVSPEGTTS